MIILVCGLCACDVIPKNQGNDDLRLYKGIPTAEIPDKCIEFGSDTCTLFSCMVEQCWCFPDNTILYNKVTTIENEDQSISLVEEYLASNDLNYDVQRSVKLNNIFYNVFAYDVDNNEEFFTVAVDGTIIKTVCGV
jgi:hypothetical protein